jgi:polyketide synthase 5
MHSACLDLSHSLRNEGKISTTWIDIIGMACRLPGSIDSPALLWDALLRGDDLITEIPPKRCVADPCAAEPGVSGRSLAP